MRWIFFTLAFLNLLTFAWGLVATSVPEEARASRPSLAEPDPYSDVPEILLLSEALADAGLPAKTNNAEAGGAGGRSVEAIMSRNEASAGVDGEHLGEGVVADNGRALCELVGPFEDKVVAATFVERLEAIEIKSTVRDVELPAGPGYWVYLAPEENRKLALRRLNELQVKGVDSYVIPRGELENGISLGVFSKKALSDARIKEMAAIGLSPKVEIIERTYRELWVMLNRGEGQKMSKLTWERAMDGINVLERRQNFCLDVASQ